MYPIRLQDRQARRVLVRQQADVGFIVDRLKLIGDEPPLDRRIRVDGRDQQVVRRFVSQRREVRTDGIPDAAELMTRGARFLENRLALRGVAGELEGRLKRLQRFQSRRWPDGG